MTHQVDTSLRGPQAYDLAQRAFEAMKSAGVWPTPLNYELWLHHVGDPEGPLSREIVRLLEAQEPFTDVTAELLAAEYLPRARLGDEIRDAGRVLDKQLASVASAVSRAHRSQVAYGKTLDTAAHDMERIDDGAGLKAIVSDLSDATRKVQRENEALEKRLEASTREVARLRDHLEQVRRDAMTDALTNLANRKAFDEQLAACCEGDASVVLAVVDIDHFKRFNDTWGHQTGDQVIRYVASVMAKAATAPRVAARYGGEEFAMIFPGESAIAVEAALNAIRTEIGSRSLRRRSTNDELGAVTISAGFAQRQLGETAASLLERADAALYESKRRGRDCVTASRAVAAARAA